MGARPLARGAVFVCFPLGAAWGCGLGVRLGGAAWFVLAWLVVCDIWSSALVIFVRLGLGLAEHGILLTCAAYTISGRGGGGGGGASAASPHPPRPPQLQSKLAAPSRAKPSSKPTEASRAQGGKREPSRASQAAKLHRFEQRGAKPRQAKPHVGKAKWSPQNKNTKNKKKTAPHTLKAIGHLFTCLV